MPRLRNTRSGVVVNVDDDTASRLDGEWVDADRALTPTASTAPADGAPRGNGTREEWASYADSLGVAYGAEAKRADIKAAIAAAEDDEHDSDENADEHEDEEKVQ